MGWRISTTLFIAKTQLQAYSVNKKILEAEEKKRKEGQKKNYDLHHGVKNLDELDPGQNVWLSDRRVTGKVLEKTPYARLYLVQSSKRSIVETVSIEFLHQIFMQNLSQRTILMS